VSDALFKKKGLGARVTMRLSERELAALKELAEAREEDLTSVIREAIGAYLHQERMEAAHRKDEAEHQRLAAEMAAGVKREADRVIERHEHTMRALIEALNVHLMSAKPGAGRR
jgi:predicted transcriptional regulator